MRIVGAFLVMTVVVFDEVDAIVGAVLGARSRSNSGELVLEYARTQELGKLVLDQEYPVREIYDGDGTLITGAVVMNAVVRKPNYFLCKGDLFVLLGRRCAGAGAGLRLRNN